MHAVALWRAAGIGFEAAVYDTPAILAGHILAAYRASQGDRKIGRRKDFGAALRSLKNGDAE